MGSGHVPPLGVPLTRVLGSSDSSEIDIVEAQNQPGVHEHGVCISWSFGKPCPRRGSRNHAEMSGCNWFSRCLNMLKRCLSLLGLRLLAKKWSALVSSREFCGVNLSHRTLDPSSFLMSKPPFPQHQAQREVNGSDPNI